MLKREKSRINIYTYLQYRSRININTMYIHINIHSVFSKSDRRPKYEALRATAKLF